VFHALVICGVAAHLAVIIPVLAGTAG